MVEDIGVKFTADTSGFTRGLSEAELALRKNGQALQDHVTALKQEIEELKKQKTPNLELIRAKQANVRQTRLEIEAVRNKINALRLEEQQTKAVTNATEKMGGAVKRASSALGGLRSALLGVLILGAAAETIKLADNMTRLRGRIQNVVGDVQKSNKVFEQLTESAKRSGSSLETVSQSFVRLAPAADELGRSNDELIKFNETVLKMGRLAGAGPEELKNAMIQLAQGIGSGRLQGDELRSVLEQIPSVGRAIAQSIGISFGELRDKASKGEVTAKEVFDAILKKSAEVDKQFENLPKTIEFSLSSLALSFSTLVENLNRFTDGTKSIAGLIDGLNSLVLSATQLSNTFQKVLGPVLGNFTALLGDLGELAHTVARAFDPLAGNVDEVTKKIRQGRESFDPFKDGLLIIVDAIDILITKSRQLTVALGGLFNILSNPLDAKTAFNQAVLQLDEIEAGYQLRKQNRRSAPPNTSALPAGFFTASPVPSNIFTPVPPPAANDKKSNKKPAPEKVIRPIRPVSGPVTSRFGLRNGEFHRGVDFGVPVGTPVKAPIEGVITKVTFDPKGGGNFVELSSKIGEDSIVNRFLHLSQSKVSVGDKIGAGQILALSGNTGRSTGPHLHQRTLVNGVDIDPLKFLASRFKGSDTALGPAGSDRDAIEAESKLLEESTKKVDLAQKELAVTFKEQEANLGAFATEYEKLALKQKNNAEEVKLLEAAYKQLSTVDVETTEAQEKKQVALQELSNSLRMAKVETKELENQTKLLNQETSSRVADLTAEREIQQRQASFDLFKRQQSQEQELLRAQLDAGLISRRQYYEQIIVLAQNASQREIQLVQLEIEKLEQKKQKLLEIAHTREQELEINNEIARKQDEINSIQADLQGEIQSTLIDKARDNGDDFGREFSQSVGQSLEQAISGVLSGGSIKDAIRGFAQSIRQALAQVVARFITEKIFGFGKNSISPSALFGVGLGKSPLQAQQSSLLSSLKSVFGGASQKTGLLSPLSSTVNGSVSGLPLAGDRLLGGGNTQTLGFSPSAVSGLSSVVKKSGLGSILGTFGKVFKPLAIIGSIAGAIFGGLFGKNKQKKQAQQEKRAQQVQSRLNAILESTDTNNLQDLQRALDEVNRVRAKGGGSAARQAKKDAQKQVLKAIEERKKAIATAVEEFGQQNAILTLETQKAEKTDLEKAALNRQQQLLQLDFDTKKLLFDFRDSQEAQTKILEQQALKRQLIYQEEKDQIKAYGEQLKGDVKSLQDLLKERDDVLNQNVFTRRRTQEKQKEDRLTELDSEIAQAFLDLQKAQAAGASFQNVFGLDQILSQVKQLSGVSAQLNIVINGANDPKAIQEQITRAFEAFSQKVLRAQLA